MNKKILLASIVVAAASFNASAADGTLTFNGEILDATCTVTGGGAATGVGDITVELPAVAMTALSAANDEAGLTPFSLVIGGASQSSCANGKIYSLVFEKDGKIDPTTGFMFNTGTATNVQVGLKKSNGDRINLYTAGQVAGDNAESEVSAGNTATIRYIAHYVSPLGNTGAGTVQAKAVYSLTYN